MSMAAGTAEGLRFNNVRPRLDASLKALQDLALYTGHLRAFGLNACMQPMVESTVGRYAPFPHIPSRS